MMQFVHTDSSQSRSFLHTFVRSKNSAHEHRDIKGSFAMHAVRRERKVGGFCFDHSFSPLNSFVLFLLVSIDTYGVTRSARTESSALHNRD